MINYKAFQAPRKWDNLTTSMPFGYLMNRLGSTVKIVVLCHAEFIQNPFLEYSLMTENLKTSATSPRFLKTSSVCG